MVAVNYLWNPINDNIVREFDDADTVVAEYTTEPDLYGSIVSQYRNGQTNYLHFDGQGNTAELTNDAGAVTASIRYSAFGEVMELTGITELPYQYGGRKGYYTDGETGTLSVRQRPLSPRLARWLSMDPLSLIDRQFAHYLYAVNSPLNYLDPSGFQAESCPAPDPECCCCATALSIPANKIFGLDRLEFPPNSGRIRPYYGVEFSVITETEWVVTDKAKGADCDLQWYEAQLVPQPRQRPDKWYDQFDLIKGSATFAPWRDRKRDCPGPESAVIVDPPGFFLDIPVRQRIYFMINLISAKECECAQPSILKCAYVEIVLGRQIGTGNVVGIWRHGAPVDCKWIPLAPPAELK